MGSQLSWIILELNIENLLSLASIDSQLKNWTKHINMKIFGITQLTLAIAIFTIATEAAKLKRINPNKARGGGPGRRGRVVKKLRNGKGRQGRQLFGTRVPIFPATPLLPPAPLRAAPVFGPAPSADYGAPAPIPAPAPAPAPAPVVIPDPVPLPEPDNAIIEVKSAPAASLYTVPNTAASERVAVVAAGPPVAITRSVYNAPGSQPGVDAWNYEFEAANGIKQNAAGEMKDIGDAVVMVMKGSYEYIGVDGLTYVVDWVADELGFRASAPHLPKSVPIPFPEVQAAVDAQLRFAAEEDRLRAAGSAPVPSYGAPAPLPAVVEVRAPIADYGLPTYGAYY